MASFSSSSNTLVGALFLVLSLSLLVGGVQGHVSHTHLSKDDRTVILVARPFGFGPNGVIEVEVSDDKIFLPENAPAANKAKIGFFITTAEAEAQLEDDLSEGGCVLDNQNIDRLFTFQEMDAQRGMDGKFEYVNRISPDKGGEYSLFFANCQPGAVISASVRVALYNEGPNGVRDYLSVGEALLPTLYMVMFVLMAVAATLWGLVIFKERANSLKIHIMMFLLVVFKTLSLLSQAGRYHMIRTTGDPHDWRIAFYVFTAFRSLTLFTVVIMIATGWSFLKPFLAEKEKNVLMLVLPLQVIANIATVVLDENTPAAKGWFTWRDVFHLLDIICCCAVLFPIVWTIKHLREAAATDGKAARNVVKLTLFRQFYVMVVSYIYFTRIVVYLLRSTMPFEYIWVSDAARELATLTFFVLTGIKFRPSEENPYFALADDERAFPL